MNFEDVVKFDEDIWVFIRDCALNWDCDADGHKYNTGCRTCAAEQLLDRKEKIGNGYL